MRTWALGDVSLDSYTNMSDMFYVKARIGTLDPWHDVDLNGAVNLGDQSLVKSWNAIKTTVPVSYSSVDNPYHFTLDTTQPLDGSWLHQGRTTSAAARQGFTGRTTDTLHASDPLVSVDPDFKHLQDNRNRTYDPKHGRWLQRDPAGYVDGMGLYEYVRSCPIGRQDPYGLYGPGPSCPPASGSRWDATLTYGGIVYNFTWSHYLTSMFDAKYILKDKDWLCSCRKVGFVQVYADRRDATGSYASALDGDANPWYSKKSVRDVTAGDRAAGQMTVSMSDTPGYAHTAFLEQRFTVCVVCEGLSGKRRTLSCITWGHEFLKRYDKVLQRLVPGSAAVKHRIYAVKRWLAGNSVSGHQAIKIEENDPGPASFIGRDTGGNNWSIPEPPAYYGAGTSDPKGLDPVVDFFSKARGIVECNYEF